MMVLDDLGRDCCIFLLFGGLLGSSMVCLDMFR